MGGGELLLERVIRAPGLTCPSECSPALEMLEYVVLHGLQRFSIPTSGGGVCRFVFLTDALAVFKKIMRYVSSVCG